MATRYGDYHPWYHTRTWRAIRARRLAIEPLCRTCNRLGVIKGACVADHVIPHAGNWYLFTSLENTQSLCEEHHNKGKHIDEIRGYSSEVDRDGWPIDPLHPFNRA